MTRDKGASPVGDRADVDSVRLACAVAPGLLSVLGAIYTLTRREGGFAFVDAETMLKNIADFANPAEIARMFTEMPAQAIEARRAETGTGSVHESAVGSADAPDPLTPSNPEIPNG